jgi:ATP-binding cassette subfamily B protein
MNLAMIVGLGSICFVLWYGGTEVIQQNLSVGDLTQFLLYLMIVAIGVGSLGSLWGDFMAGIGASKRVFEILEKSPESNNSGRILDNLEGKIEFKDVFFSYPSRPDIQVLKGINLSISAGKVIALVGPSGGGKSTLTHLLPRFYDLEDGSILIDGIDIKEFNLQWLRSHIGLVSQEPILISSTIAENICYGCPDADLSEVIRAAKAAFCYEFIEKFPERFKTQVGEKGIQLSGGQKQRIAIARALLKDPQILILDEATSNLDSESEKFVQEALASLMKGRTTLVIAHRLTTIQNADLICVVSDGVIVQSGNHEELKQNKKGLYYQLLQKQFHESNDAS